MFAALRKTILSLEALNSSSRKLLTVGITVRGCQLTSRRTSSCGPLALKQKFSPKKLNSCYVGRACVRSSVKNLCTGLSARHVGSCMANTSTVSMSTYSLLRVVSHGRVQPWRSCWLTSPPSRRCYSDDSDHSNNSDSTIDSTASNDVRSMSSVQDERIIQVDQLLSHVQVESETEKRPLSRWSSEMTIGECVEILREEKACNLVVIGLEGEEAESYAGYFVTCSGLSTRHLRSMTTCLAKEMKGVEVTGVKRVFVEGEDCDDWMVVDMGNIVVHFLLEERRSELELEKLWLLGSDYDDQLRAARNVDNLY